MWQTSISNRPGVLAETLEPFAHAGVDLNIVMKYSLPGHSDRATIEILAGSERRAAGAAQAAGFTLSPTPVLLVEGDNRPGLAYSITNSVAWAGIALRFLSAQIVGTHYSALLGFKTDTDAQKAQALIRKVMNTSVKTET
jgi:hypothetical protein